MGNVATHLTEVQKVTSDSAIERGYPTGEEILPSKSRLVLICNIVNFVILICIDFLLLL